MKKIITISIVLLFLLCSTVWSQYGNYGLPYGNQRIERVSGSIYYGPHPGCMMCLGNHLIAHGYSYNYLNSVGYNNWQTLHDNTHNAPMRKAQAPKPIVKAKPIFAATPQFIVNKMLDLADAKDGDVVVDLGCGDGRIVITAARDYKCQSFGYEINPELVQLAKKAVAKEGLNNAYIRQHDMFKVDLSKTDIATLYLEVELNDKLVPQLMNMKKGARIVSYNHNIPKINQQQVYKINDDKGVEHVIYLWVVPISLKP